MKDSSLVKWTCGSGDFSMHCMEETMDTDYLDSFEMIDFENFDQSNKMPNRTDGCLITKGEYISNHIPIQSISETSGKTDTETVKYKQSEIHLAGMKEEPTLGTPALILLYMIVSISIVLFNYWIFSGITGSPVLVSWFQQLFGLAIFQLIKMKNSKLRFGLDEFMHFEDLEWETAKSMIPLALSFIGTVSLSNICLKYVLVSTYQVARSTTIIFNLILSYAILKQSFSLNTMISCIIVMIGFIIGAFDSKTLSANGVIFGICSSIIQSFYSVLVKKKLNVVNNNQIQLLYYQLFLSSIMFIPILIITGEIVNLFSIFNFNQGIIKTLLILNCLIVSGVLSVMINISTFKLINRTNSITFNIVALLKSTIQSIGGILIFNEDFTTRSIFGIILTILGTFMYSIDINPRISSKYSEYEDLESLA
ncbi:DP-fucose transporter [Cryptosporidium canis]|uniref:DP-fucose transporter n=1 Tax=Cryptosporidium canis TaxID=195482 RepID=A0A9D5DF96_9CRYT|nr:DP-fucose transporter [Cryptosporidium canis]